MTSEPDNKEEEDEIMAKVNEQKMQKPMNVIPCRCTRYTEKLFSLDSVMPLALQPLQNLMDSSTFIRAIRLLLYQPTDASKTALISQPLKQKQKNRQKKNLIIKRIVFLCPCYIHSYFIHTAKTILMIRI